MIAKKVRMPNERPKRHPFTTFVPGKYFCIRTNTMATVVNKTMSIAVAAGKIKPFSAKILGGKL
jgi:hypothetical protein